METHCQLEISRMYLSFKFIFLVSDLAVSFVKTIGSLLLLSEELIAIFIFETLLQLGILYFWWIN